MAIRSILDLDEARRRLERMEQDHLQWVELIGKLKQMRDALSQHLAASEKAARDFDIALQRATVTGAKLEELQRTAKESMANLVSSTTGEVGKALGVVREAVDGAGAKVRVLVKGTEKALGELQQQQQQRLRTAEAKIADGLQAVRSALSDALTKLDAKFKAREGELTRAFEDFRTKHFAALDEVTRAHDRMRTAYDSMRIATQAYETEVAGLRKRLEDGLLETAAALGEHKDLVSSELADSKQALARTEQLVRVLQAELSSETSNREKQLAASTRKFRWLAAGLVVALVLSIAALGAAVLARWLPLP